MLVCGFIGGHMLDEIFYHPHEVVEEPMVAAHALEEPLELRRLHRRVHRHRSLEVLLVRLEVSGAPVAQLDRSHSAPHEDAADLAVRRFDPERVSGLVGLRPHGLLVGARSPGRARNEGRVLVGRISRRISRPTRAPNTSRRRSTARVRATASSSSCTARRRATTSASSRCSSRCVSRRSSRSRGTRRCASASYVARRRSRMAPCAS